MPGPSPRDNPPGQVTKGQLSKPKSNWRTGGERGGGLGGAGLTRATPVQVRRLRSICAVEWASNLHSTAKCLADAFLSTCYEGSETKAGTASLIRLLFMLADFPLCENPSTKGRTFLPHVWSLSAASLVEDR